MPYQDRALGRAFNNQFSDEVYQQFIKQGRVERAQHFYDALDPKGQAAIRYGMQQEAVQQATDPITGTLDSTKLGTYLLDRQKASDVLFKGAGKWELEGLLNLVKHDAQLAGRGANTPLVGSASPLLGWLLGLKGGIPGSALTLSLAGAKWLMSNERHRQFLLAATLARRRLIARTEVEMFRIHGVPKRTLRGAILGGMFQALDPILSRLLQDLWRCCSV